MTVITSGLSQFDLGKATRLCPEAYDPLVRKEVIEDLRETLADYPVYEHGTPDPRSEYNQWLSCDLDHAFSPDETAERQAWIQERIFRYLLPAYTIFPERFAIYIGLFFKGARGVINKNDPLVNRLKERMIRLTKSPSEKTQIAAFSILKNAATNCQLLSPAELQLIEQERPISINKIVLEEASLPNVLITIVEEYLTPPQLYKDDVNPCALDPMQLVEYFPEGRRVTTINAEIEFIWGEKLTPQVWGLRSKICYNNLSLDDQLFYGHEHRNYSRPLKDVFRVTSTDFLRKPTHLSIPPPLPTVQNAEPVVEPQPINLPTGLANDTSSVPSQQSRGITCCLGAFCSAIGRAFAQLFAWLRGLCA